MPLTEQELQNKELEILNNYLGEEARKLSTGQIIKNYKTSAYYEDVKDLGQKIREEINPYRYMLEEENVVQYLQIVGTDIFGKK